MPIKYFKVLNPETGQEMQVPIEMPEIEPAQEIKEFKEENFQPSNFSVLQATDTKNSFLATLGKIFVLAGVAVGVPLILLVIARKPWPLDAELVFLVFGGPIFLLELLIWFIIKRIFKHRKEFAVKRKEAENLLSQAMAFIGNEEHQRAIKILDKAIRLDPKNSALYLARAKAYWEIGDYSVCVDEEIIITNLTKAIKYDSKNIEAHKMRAMVYHRVERYKEALKDRLIVAKFNPEDAEICSKVAGEYSNLGNYKKAVEWYTKAINLDPLNRLYYSHRSDQYRLLEDYEKAINDCDKVVALKPDDHTSFSRRAWMYGMFDQYSLAERDYIRALEINPRPSPLDFITIAETYMKLDEYGKAAHNFTKAIELAGKENNDPYLFWLAYSGRSEAREKLGNRKKAREDNRQAEKFKTSL